MGRGTVAIVNKVTRVDVSERGFQQGLDICKAFSDAEGTARAGRILGCLKQSQEAITSGAS